MIDKKSLMNGYYESLMDAPSLKSDFCVICGRPAQSQHHVVPRSQGGTNGPMISVCGIGNESGCHGRLHGHTLHVSWTALLGWERLFTDEPMKYEKALEMGGWEPIIPWD